MADLSRTSLGQSPSFPSGMPCRQRALAPLCHGRFSLLSGTMGLHRRWRGGLSAFSLASTSRGFKASPV